MAVRAEYMRMYLAYRSRQPGFLSVSYIPRYPLAPVQPAPPPRKQVRDDAAAGAGPQRSAFSSVDAGHGAAPPPGQRARSAAPRPPPRLKVQRHVFQSPPPAARKTTAQLRAELARLEARLPLGQVICYRAYAALWHSQYLKRNPSLETRWMAAMDVVTIFADALLGMDNEDDEEAAAAAGGFGEEGRAGAAPSVLTLQIVCPCVGVKLINRSRPQPAPLGTAAAGGARLGQAGAKPSGVAAASAAAAPGGLAAGRPSASMLAVTLYGIKFNMPTLTKLKLQVRAGAWPVAPAPRPSGTLRQPLGVPCGRAPPPCT
jgi:hypothetical protein